MTILSTPVVSILSEESVHREWSTVVDISITPPSFKPVSFSLSRFSLSKTSKQVFFLTQSIYFEHLLPHSFYCFIIYFFRLTSKGASEGAQSYTAYKKFKASDSVTAGTTTSTTSTTSTPTPSINITSTFQYLGCYKPPSSLTTALTTDVDYVYTVPFDTSKYKAVPAFDRSLSGYHGTLKIETMKFT